MLKLAVSDSGDDYVNSLDFDECCVAHYTEMINYARRLTNGDVEKARDVVQESMLKAVRQWPSFRPADVDVLRSTRAWLYRIVQHTFITGYHSERVHRKRDEENAMEVLRGSSGHESNHSDPPEQLTTSPMGDEVLAALDRLSADHREVVVLHYVEGFSCEEIAEKIGKPKNTVFTRLARARVVLARALQFYARAEYGYGVTVRKKSSGVRPQVQAAESVQVEEADGGGVDGVVAVDDDRALEDADSAGYELTAW